MFQGETAVAVPDFQSFMLPVLRLMADGKEHSLAELHGRLAGEMQLAPADLEEKLPSGTQTKYSIAFSGARFISPRRAC
jgi:restriction system protein